MTAEVTEVLERFAPPLYKKLPMRNGVFRPPTGWALRTTTNNAHIVQQNES